MRALIDVDIFRYQFGSIKQRHPFLENEFIPSPPEEVIKLIEDQIDEILLETGADSYICPISGVGNFRLDIAKQAPYKGNRNPNEERPYHYNTVGQHIILNHPSVVVNDREADDWLGIEQRKDPENTIICSRDKDLWTVYGWHYGWACGDKQPKRPKHWVTPFEARRFFFQQMLTGDNTDNIIGCGIKREVMWGGKLQMRRKGVGEKEAIKLLEDCKTVAELYEVVKEQYERIFFEDEYVPEDVMLENARLLYIGQDEDNLFNWDWLDYELNKEENNVS